MWFALDESRPLAFFAGIWTGWTCTRKVAEGEISCDLFAFLTTNANAEVGAIHPKAMPLILEPIDQRALAGAGADRACIETKRNPAIGPHPVAEHAGADEVEMVAARALHGARMIIARQVDRH